MSTPMTDERLAEARATIENSQNFGDMLGAASDLLAEVDRLRAELAKSEELRGRYARMLNDDPARIKAEARASVALGTSDYTEPVKRPQAPVLTMEQALRIVDAICGVDIGNEDGRTIYERAVRDARRRARAETVLRVANEGGRE